MCTWVTTGCRNFQPGARPIDSTTQQWTRLKCLYFCQCLQYEHELHHQPPSIWFVFLINLNPSHSPLIYIYIYIVILVYYGHKKGQLFHDIFLKYSTTSSHMTYYNVKFKIYYNLQVLNCKINEIYFKPKIFQQILN